MKERFDEKLIRKNLRNAISDYCNMAISKGECSDGDCLSCSVSNVYDLASENELYFKTCDDGVRRLYKKEGKEADI